MKKLILAVFLLSLLSFNLHAEIPAQDKDIDATTQLVDPSNDVNINYEEVSHSLSDMEASIKSKQIGSHNTNQHIKTLSSMSTSLVEAKKQIEQALNFANKRMEVLGEEPKDGTFEADTVAQKRQEFSGELSSLKARQAEIDIALAKIDELETLILQTHSEELLVNILNKKPPLIYPSTFFHSTSLFVDFLVDIIKSPIIWFDGLSAAEKNNVKNNFIPAVLVVLASLLVGISLRKFIMKYFGYNKSIEHPRYSTKVSAAFCVALAYGIIPASIIGAFIIWVYHTPIMTLGFFGLVLRGTLFYMLYVFLVKGFARVVFAPYNERWRLLRIDTPRAKRLTNAFYFTIIIIGITSFLMYIARSANYPPELIYLLVSLGSIIKSFCIVLIVKRFIWEEDVVSKDECDYDIEGELEKEKDEAINPAVKTLSIVSLACIIISGLAFIGYPNLSSFILNRIIGTALILGLFVIIRKSLSEVLQRILITRFFVKTFKLRRRMLVKINFWFSLVCDPLLILGTIFLLLNMWGVSSDLLLQIAKKALLGFKVGGMQISPLNIIMGIITFFVSLAVVKIIKKRLCYNILDKVGIEDSIKHSLASGIGFLGFIVSFILAIVVMGGNLTNIALIAGGLSLGIGFGLQNIVNNFISGIILLFERPIKVGDWIVFNGQEGFVKQINIRSTELETWQKSNVIIPNADILSNSVVNMTLRDKWGRVDIKVGVAYGTDIDRVKRILLEIANENKRVLKKPEPYVLFMDFAESSMVLELRCHLSDVMSRLSIASEIRTEISRRFMKEKIEIPFPQRVVHTASQNVKFLDKMVGEEKTSLVNNGKKKK